MMKDEDGDEILAVVVEEEESVEEGDHEETRRNRARISMKSRIDSRKGIRTQKKRGN